MVQVTLSWTHAEQHMTVCRLKHCTVHYESVKDTKLTYMYMAGTSKTGTNAESHNHCTWLE